MSADAVPVDLEAVRRLCDAATPGPWQADVSEIYDETRSVWIGETLNVDDELATEANAEFIAAARTLVPQLLAEVERLRDLVEAASRARFRQGVELRDAGNDLLDVRGILSPNGYEPKTPLSLVPTVAPAVAWLVGEVERLRQVAEAAQAWRRMRDGTPTIPKPESAALLAAVEAYEAAGGEVR